MKFILLICFWGEKKQAEDDLNFKKSLYQVALPSMDTGFIFI